MADADLVTTVVVAAVTSGATNVVSAPLDAVADHLKERVKGRLNGTLEKAAAKAGDRPLEYSDRVAAKTLNEAAFNDDELVADYLGGVLAASSPEDDAGAAIVAQIGRLSALQLRLHYVVYRELRRLWIGKPLNLYLAKEARKAGVRIPVVDLVAAQVRPEALASAVPALVREGLLADTWDVGMENDDLPPDVGFTMRVRATGIGAELFLWGHGVRPAHAARLFEADLKLTMLTGVAPTPRASLLQDPRLMKPSNPDAAGTQ